MNNSDARFMLEEINARIAKRRRPLEYKTLIKWKALKKWIEMDLDVNEDDSKFLLELHQRMTEPTRLKW